MIYTKTLTDIEIDGINPRDCTDFVDAFVTDAYCTERERYLTDDELDELNENHPEIAQELALESLY